MRIEHNYKNWPLIGDFRSFGSSDALRQERVLDQLGCCSSSRRINDHTAAIRKKRAEGSNK